MRVIYIVRAAQLLVTLRALWMLYSVSSFCEKTHHTMKACSDMIARIPLATPEQIAEHERIRQQRPASNRPKTTSDASTTTTTPAPTSIESSTVTPSTTATSSEEVKKREKREERRELPGNGMTEAQRKAADAVVVSTKEEEKKMEKKEEQKGEETTPIPGKKETPDEKKEEKKEEKVKVAETTPVPSKNEKEEVKKEKTDEKKEQKKKEEVKVEEKKKEEVKVDETTPSAVKKEDKKEQPAEKKEEKKPAQPKVEKTEVKVGEKKRVSVETTTTKSPNKEEKEHRGAKVEIPVAPAAKKEEQPAEKPATSKADPAPSSEEKHHTVKKDLKAHVQEPVKVETTKESTTGAPKLAPAQQRFVLEHSETFLQEVRCLEVTSDDYFGKEISPFAAHLKGLVFVGPVLVVVTIYLVCTVLRTRLCAEHPTEFTDSLGIVFHIGMWLVVGLSMYFIYDHWALNWQTVSAGTFMPEFPCAWCSLIMLSSLMVLATSIEMWFHKQLYCDIVFERSYRTYEVIENADAAHNESAFSRTNVY